MVECIVATRQALDVIASLKAEFGAIMFHQADGCIEGGGAHCYKVDEIPIASDEVKFGEIAGVPFYVGPRLYESWRRTQVIIDVGAGSGDDSFSLESLRGCHFINRWRGLDDPASAAYP